MLKKLIFVLMLTISINAQTMEEVMEEKGYKKYLYIFET